MNQIREFAKIVKKLISDLEVLKGVKTFFYQFESKNTIPVNCIGCRMVSILSLLP